MSEPQTWRELLREIIKNSHERKRIAAALGVNPITIVRWMRSETAPRGPHLQRLLELIPQLQPLIAEEFDALSSLPSEAPPGAIPITFYNHVLGLYATVPDHQRFWSICTAVLQEAAKHLGSRHVDLDISVVQCLAPYQGNIVRCLREHVGLGTSPGKEQVELRMKLFGAESLAGYVVESGHPSALANLSEEQGLPHQLPEQARSAAAFPIFHASRIAGCLLVASTKPDYFRSPALLDLIEAYTTLLALAFDPEDFYESQSIKLGIMPSFQVQDSYFATFQQRVKSMLKESVADQQPINFVQAEQRAWWQIAEELLGISPRLLPET
ncbi:MAG TPA: GAF domain-containing protein [Ktedonobacteraceae bacterium]|nr:GAF domain-containing protein [Ktedonobacteraceae bacterium]